MAFSIKAYPPRFDKLSVFSLLWGITNVIHLYSFPLKANFSYYFAFPLLVAAVFVIVNPRSIPGFLILISFSILNTLMWMPMAPNHFILEFFINTSILASVGWYILFNYRENINSIPWEDPEFRDNIFKAFAPIARISLIILYFYAVLHKLNTDYLDPNISCSAFMLENMSKKFPILPNDIFSSKQV